MTSIEPVREWIVDGRAHNVTACGECGHAIDPGGAQPRPVAVEDGKPLCGTCVSKRLDIVAVIGGWYEIEPVTWSTHVCACAACAAAMGEDIAIDLSARRTETVGRDDPRLN